MRLRIVSISQLPRHLPKSVIAWFPHGKIASARVMNVSNLCFYFYFYFYYAFAIKYYTWRLCNSLYIWFYFNASHTARQMLDKFFWWPLMLMTQIVCVCVHAIFPFFPSFGYISNKLFPFLDNNSRTERSKERTTLITHLCALFIRYYCYHSAARIFGDFINEFMLSMWWKLNPAICYCWMQLKLFQRTSNIWHTPNIRWVFLCTADFSIGTHIWCLAWNCKSDYNKPQERDKNQQTMNIINKTKKKREKKMFIIFFVSLLSPPSKTVIMSWACCFLHLSIQVYYIALMKFQMLKLHVNHSGGVDVRLLRIAMLSNHF